MAGEDRSIDKLAEAVADGTPIDWAAEGDGASDRPHLLAGLRIVEQVARIARQKDAASGESVCGTSPDAAARVEGEYGADAGARRPIEWSRLLIREQVGAGAFAAVYRAWDPALDREVALKVVRPDETGGARVADIIREGRLLARVRHPNVVAVYSVSQSGGSVGLAMELIGGQSLAQILEDRGPFPASEAARIGIDLCAALDAVHRAGLVHRDVKAQNVMRETGGRLVLMDFGVGCESAAAGARGLAGTPRYVAPELFERGDATVQSDIYSLGVLLYQLVTGTFPVHGASLEQLRDAHRNGPFVRLSDTGHDVPASFARVVERALTPNPSARYKSAAEMQAALAATLTNDDQASARRRAWPALLRSSLSIVGAAAAALAVAAVTWLVVRTPPGHTAGFRPRGWLLVARFDNVTGDRRLDGSVEYALERELASSRFVNIVPRERINDTLTLMKKPIDTEIDAAIGREVCLRDGAISGILTGRVEKLGTRYGIAARVVDPATGRQFVATSVDVSDLGDLYRAIRSLANALRDGLGESLEGGRRGELESVTTASLHAAQLYSRAYALMTFGFPDDDAELEQMFSEAAREDPEFASAYIMLAWLHKNRGEPRSDYLALAELALKYAGRATERERLFIRASHAGMAGDTAQAIATYEALLRMYPDDYWANNNLAFIFENRHEPERAVRYRVRRAEIRPNNYEENCRTAGELWGAGHDGEAAPFVARARALLTPELAAARPGYAAFVEGMPVCDAWRSGNPKAALAYLERAFDFTSHSPVWMRGPVADWLTGLGRLASAEAFYQTQFSSGGSFPQVGAAWVALLRGDRQAAARAMRQRLRASPSGESFGYFALVTLARADMASEARAALRHAKKQATILFEAREETHVNAEIALAEHRYSDAIRLLQPLTSGKYYDNEFLLASEALASAEEAVGDRAKAVAVLERAAHRKSAVCAVAGPAADVWLNIQAKRAALLRQLGRSNEAETVEAELRQLLALADADHPVLAQLRGRPSSLTAAEATPRR